MKMNCLICRVWKIILYPVFLSLVVSQFAVAFDVPTSNEAKSRLVELYNSTGGDQTRDGGTALAKLATYHNKIRFALTPGAILNVDSTREAFLEQNIFEILFLLKESRGEDYHRSRFAFASLALFGLNDQELDKFAPTYPIDELKMGILRADLRGRLLDTDFTDRSRFLNIQINLSSARSHAQATESSLSEEIEAFLNKLRTDQRVDEFLREHISTQRHISWAHKEKVDIYSQAGLSLKTDPFTPPHDISYDRKLANYLQPNIETLLLGKPTSAYDFETVKNGLIMVSGIAALPIAPNSYLKKILTYLTAADRGSKLFRAQTAQLKVQAAQSLKYILEQHVLQLRDYPEIINSVIQYGKFLRSQSDDNLYRGPTELEATLKHRIQLLTEKNPPDMTAEMLDFVVNIMVEDHVNRNKKYSRFTFTRFDLSKDLIWFHQFLSDSTESILIRFQTLFKNPKTLSQLIQLKEENEGLPELLLLAEAVDHKDPNTLTTWNYNLSTSTWRGTFLGRLLAVEQYHLNAREESQTHLSELAEFRKALGNTATLSLIQLVLAKIISMEPSDPIDVAQMALALRLSGRIGMNNLNVQRTLVGWLEQNHFYRFPLHYPMETFIAQVRTALNERLSLHNPELALQLGTQNGKIAVIRAEGVAVLSSALIANPSHPNLINELINYLAALDKADDFQLGIEILAALNIAELSPNHVNRLQSILSRGNWLTSQFEAAVLGNMSDRGFGKLLETLYTQDRVKFTSTNFKTIQIDVGRIIYNLAALKADPIKLASYIFNLSYRLEHHFGSVYRLEFEKKVKLISAGNIHWEESELKRRLNSALGPAVLQMVKGLPPAAANEDENTIANQWEAFAALLGRLGLVDDELGEALAKWALRETYHPKYFTYIAQRIPMTSTVRLKIKTILTGLSFYSGSETNTMNAILAAVKQNYQQEDWNLRHRAFDILARFIQSERRIDLLNPMVHSISFKKAIKNDTASFPHSDHDKELAKVLTDFIKNGACRSIVETQQF